MYIVFIRVLIIYALIILSLRLMGKRQIGQLQPSELVVTILVSNIATMAIEDSNVPLIGGIIPILTLVSFDVLISAMTLRYKKMRRIVSGTPRVIIRDGVLYRTRETTRNMLIVDQNGDFTVRTDRADDDPEAVGAELVGDHVAGAVDVGEAVEKGIPEAVVDKVVGPPAVAHVEGKGDVLRLAVESRRVRDSQLFHMLQAHDPQGGGIMKWTTSAQAAAFSNTWRLGMARRMPWLVIRCSITGKNRICRTAYL